MCCPLWPRPTESLAVRSRMDGSIDKWVCAIADRYANELAISMPIKMTTKVNLKAVSASKEHLLSVLSARSKQENACSRAIVWPIGDEEILFESELTWNSVAEFFFFITMKLETLWRNKLKVHLVKEVGATCNLPFSCDAAWKSSVTWKITAKLQARSKFRLCMIATSSISNHESRKKMHVH